MLDRSFITAYENGAARLREAIVGLTREDLVAFPIPGTWSIQQLTVHLADAEQVLADRMKRVICEKAPIVLAFDENAWLKSMAPEAQSAQDAAAIVELTRRQMARVLRALPDEAFARQAMHNEAGLMTLQQFVERSAWHLEHHLKFLVDKRAKLGKPL